MGIGIGVVMLVSVGVFFALIFLFTRNYVLASLITFYVSLWYFFFGALHDWIKSYRILSFTRSYSVLLPLLLLSTFLLFIFLKRKKKYRP